MQNIRFKRVGSTFPPKKLCRLKNYHYTAFFGCQIYTAENMLPGDLNILPPYYAALLTH